MHRAEWELTAQVGADWVPTSEHPPPSHAARGWQRHWQCLRKSKVCPREGWEARGGAEERRAELTPPLGTQRGAKGRRSSYEGREKMLNDVCHRGDAN